MKKIMKLEERCDGQMTYYDINTNVKCGNIIHYNNVKCEYLKKGYCNNDYQNKTIIQYIKK